ncbi:MAG: outer-membrane lipoprotein carrier protein LolA [Ignavibacteriota bacterium]
MTSMDRHKPLFCAALALLVSTTISAGQTLEQTLAKMDQAASHFKALSAKVEYVQHMEAIHEDDGQSGTILVKRAHPKELHVKISIDKPDPKVAVADGNKVVVYYPHSGEKQELALGHRRSLVDMILTLGFGGSSKELQDAYAVTLGGADTVAGESTTRLELIPKSKDLLAQWRKIDLWISDKTGNAVQQKFYERGKDYTLITYSGLQQNPEIAESSFKLDVPKGTVTKPLNKK